MVKWVDASRWDTSDRSFAIEAALPEILTSFGKGVYTMVIWASVGDDYFPISNYSLFFQ